MYLELGLLSSLNWLSEADGMNVPRKVKTKAEVDKTAIFPLYFMVTWDNNGLHIFVTKKW